MAWVGVSPRHSEPQSDVLFLNAYQNVKVTLSSHTE